MVTQTNEYRALHYWLRRHFEMPKRCEICNISLAKEWACIDKKYSKLRSGYKALCVSCHRQFDHSGSFTHCKHGHERSKNTYQYPITKVKSCRLCLNINTANYRKRLRMCK